jgi:hypothetical protein
MKPENSALVKSNYDELPKQANKTKDSTFDRIYKYYHSEKSRVELTKIETDIRERLEKAWLLLCRHRTRKQVAEIIEKLFKVSRSVAYDDIRNAMMLFSNPQEDLKDAKRAIHEEMALRGADRCWKNNDMDGYWKFVKEYREVNNLTGEGSDAIGDLLKNLKPLQIIIVASQKELENEARALQEELTHDVEYEDAK